MNIRKLKKLICLFTITVLSTGFLSCERAQRALQPPTSTEPSGKIEDSTAWVVDQNGVEVPVLGTWQIVEVSHPNSIFKAGALFVLPPDPPHQTTRSEGTYTGADGVPWTKVNIITHDGTQLMFLERVDTSVKPHRLHLVFKTDTDGTPLLEYGEFPFDIPHHDVHIWEKK